MAGELPVGQDWPRDNQIEFTANSSTFHAYVHVPFCEVRCGYCDFNTYTSSELGDVKQSTFHEALIQEIELSNEILRKNHYPTKRLRSIFYGGGTPTKFEPEQLMAINLKLKSEFGLVEDAEITTESNPDSISERGINYLAEAGFNRISFGVQSFDPKVLAVLDRTHRSENVPKVVAAAKQAGLRASLDLIFGTPGETLESWGVTLDRAIELGPEHISAYALIVEPGTALARKIKSGQIASVDEDLLADMYELASQKLEAAGLAWYEISNWGNPSVHNLAYWQSQDWWGYGPGAHSHVSGVRWWNRKHPTAYLLSLKTGSPAQGFERLDARTILEEQLMLGLRTSYGVPRSLMNDLGVSKSLIASSIAQGRLELISGGNIRVGLGSRFLADGLILELLSSSEV